MEADVLKLPGTQMPYVETYPVTTENCRPLADWLLSKHVARWMDYGNGKQDISELQLSMILISQRNYARLFRIPGESEPLGIFCLNSVDNAMNHAEVWAARNHLNRQRRSGSYRHATASAAVQILADGFLDLNLKVISSWAVECNRNSIQLHDAVGMRQTGILRKRHVIDGKRYNRICYDITLEEFGERYPDVVSGKKNTYRNSYRNQTQ
ncbi:GNAT family N-acetyltransferase [Gynuella sp.]|uniref:GNAT family N-acetyltransferase n=1 Tax=Gynuella sp. TaxID=2969146 RepID=UPI003D10F71A